MVLDGRTKEARLLEVARAELRSHIGDHPSKVQEALVERAARLTLYVENMDAKAMAAGGMSESDSRQYLAWSNALTRALGAIGLKAKPTAPSLSVADIAARHAKAASA